MCSIIHRGSLWSKMGPLKTVTTTGSYLIPEVSKLEFDQLKKEVIEMKELLRKAKIYDEENNEPDCEIETKMNFLREIAKLVGVELDDVLKPKQ